MKIFTKIFLLLLYPFVYLFHPEIRKMNASRAKYWLMDNDFFKKELKLISLSSVIAILFYGFLFYGVGHIVGGAKTAAYTIQKNYGDTIDAYEEKNSSNAMTRSQFDTNTVDKIKEVKIEEKEYKEIEKTVDHKEIMDDNKDEFQNLLEEARKKKQ